MHAGWWDECVVRKLLQSYKYSNWIYNNLYCGLFLPKGRKKEEKKKRTYNITNWKSWMFYYLGLVEYVDIIFVCTHFLPLLPHCTSIMFPSLKPELFLLCGQLNHRQSQPSKQRLYMVGVSNQAISPTPSQLIIAYKYVLLYILCNINFVTRFKSSKSSVKCRL